MRGFIGWLLLLPLVFAFWLTMTIANACAKRGDGLWRLLGVLASLAIGGICAIVGWALGPEEGLIIGWIALISGGLIAILGIWTALMGTREEIEMREQMEQLEKEPTSPPLASFVLLLLARILAAVEDFPKNDREHRRANILKEIAAETFRIGGVIGAERPDLVVGIVEQCCEEPEQVMKEIRTTLNEVLNIHGLRLESLPYRMTGYAAEILQNRRPSHRLDDWDQTLYDVVTTTSFLPGCVLGYEHTQLFWDMLQRELRRTIEEDSLPLAVQMNAFYGPVLSEESKKVLEALMQGGLETPVQKLMTLYQEIARAILANYERESSSLPI